MRILMVAACPLPWARGTPIRIHRMAEALARRGHDIHVVTYPLGDEAQPLPYRIHRVARGFRRLNPEPGPSAAKLLYLDPLLVAKLRRLLRAEEFDLVHAHHYEGLITALIARRLSRRLPLVYDAHTLLESELPFYRLVPANGFMASVGRFLDRRIPPAADRVIAVSERIRARLLQDAHVGSDRISVVPNGVELEHFAKRDRPDDAHAAGPRIAFAGNLAGYQGIDLLLEAFARVLEAAPDARLHFLTHSAPRDVTSLVRASGVAHAVEFSDPGYAELPDRLAAADVLVNPRVDCDGIPQKLLNYMASARPIVSFESSAPLLAHEADALVVPDGDTRAFAGAVLRLLREPALGRALGEAARDKVVAGHSWDRVAERVEAVYRSMSEQQA